MILLLLAQLGGSTLNLNQQPIETRQNGGRLSTTRQYAIDCRTNMTCTVDGGVLLLSAASGGASSGGAPVDGGFVVWTSVGSTNERVLTAGTSTSINTGTAGQIKVDVVSPVSTASALAADPTDCGANQYATTIAANGNLTCAQVSYAQVSGTPTLAYQTVQDEGVGLTARSTIDFTGAGVTCTDTGAKTSCSISGGGGGGGTSPLILSFGGF